MKKSKIILTMATMAGMLALTGCNAEISIKDSEGQETSTIVIENSMEENTESNIVVNNATQNSDENSHENYAGEIQTDSQQILSRAPPDSTKSSVVNISP